MVLAPLQPGFQGPLNNVTLRLGLALSGRLHCKYHFINLPLLRFGDTLEMIPCVGGCLGIMADILETFLDPNFQLSSKAVVENTYFGR